MKNYERKRILVTGRAGSHLCERLLFQGNDVLCVGNFFTGSEDNITHPKVRIKETGWKK